PDVALNHDEVAGRSPCGSADRNRNRPRHRPVTSVAPRAGARIETVYRARGEACRPVAPRAGAPIETDPDIHHSPGWSTSLPVRERGSKLLCRLRQVVIHECRSPCGSADRNEIGKRFGTEANKSLPVRERGSKRFWSHARLRPARVAPRAGARIETFAGGC